MMRKFEKTVAIASIAGVAAAALGLLVLVVGLVLAIWDNRTGADLVYKIGASLLIPGISLSVLGTIIAISMGWDR